MSKSILDTAEVIHDYMRNGDRSTSREECITWIAQLIQEASQQAPSAADRLFCNWYEMEYAPSATVDEKTQTIAELIFAVATNADETEESRIAWIKREMLDTLVARVKNSQQPTVDEKIKAIAQRLAQHVTFDRKEAIVSGCIKVGYTNHNVAELIEEGITEYLRSQQPTVDVDALWAKHSFTDCHDDFEQEIITEESFKKALTEALRGSYKREDMIAFLMKYSGLLNPSNRIAKERVSKWLDQYDTEKGK